MGPFNFPSVRSKYQRRRPRVLNNYRKLGNQHVGTGLGKGGEIQGGSGHGRRGHRKDMQIDEERKRRQV